VKRYTLLALLALFLSTTAFAGENAWLTSWDAAAKQSQKTGKPILMDFTGSDWCLACKLLEKEVFSTPDFQAWAAKKVVLLKVDFPKKTALDAKTTAQNAKLKEKYKVPDALPYVVFADGKGKQLATYNYEKGGAQNWLKKADAKLKGKTSAK
jgi:thiol:disulfide interchange protein